MRQTSHSSHFATRTRTRRQNAGITISPLRGFFITLLFLGVPTVSLGTVCLALIQNNLRLSETNDELHEIASEVKAEVDSLGAEIDTLRERAGVPETDQELQTSAGATADTDAGLDASSAAKAEGRQAKVAKDLATRNWKEASLFESGLLANALSPKGGLSNAIDPVAMLRDVQNQIPKLSKALDANVKPALEETLAEEAAFPDGVPVVGKVEVSSEFGIRGNPFGGSGYEMHEGIDFVGASGDIIAATGDGVVTLAGAKGGYGNTVTIDHDYGYETLYAHLSEIKVEAGQTVKRGQIIGYMGSTGRSTGPHLHYSIYKNDQAINPRRLLKLNENSLEKAL
ncbi:MAG: M23 family metallopeptidase [Phormidesmis sp.]